MRALGSGLANLDAACLPLRAAASTHPTKMRYGPVYRSAGGVITCTEFNRHPGRRIDADVLHGDRVLDPAG